MSLILKSAWTSSTLVCGMAAASWGLLACKSTGPLAVSLVSSTVSWWEAEQPTGLATQAWSPLISALKGLAKSKDWMLMSTDL